MELSRQFETAGLTAKGLSRRSLQYYVNTHDEELNTPKGVEYGHEYFEFTQTLISIL